MNRKRDNPYSSPYPNPKRRRPVHERLTPANDTVEDRSKKGHTVVVMGLGSECSVLDLKSRFQIYGPISRTRFDPNGLAYVTFRAHDAAHDAVTASKDPSFQLTLQSRPLQVVWATDPVPQWREAVSRKDGITTLSSRLVRAEIPLSRRGRGNKLGSAIVKPRDENNFGNTNDIGNNTSNVNNSIDDKTDGHSIGDSKSSVVDATFKGREIVAYDDIL